MSALEVGLSLAGGPAPEATAVAGDWLDELAGRGWAVRKDFAPALLTDALRDEAIRLHEAEALRRAGVGRAGDHEINRDIRRDKVAWLEGETLAQVQYLELMEQVRLAVNAGLFLGLFDFETHFAVYEPGGFYARHVDAFRGARNRILSTVFYLNPDWVAGDGGELAIWPAGASDGDQPAAVIPPEAGTLALFLSEEIPHEVLAAQRARYSIAGWFRVREDAPA